jgi:hypothetical protein
VPVVLGKTTSVDPFADNVKCSRVFRNLEDCAALQRDLTSVSKWSNDWGQQQVRGYPENDAVCWNSP